MKIKENKEKNGKNNAECEKKNYILNNKTQLWNKFSLNPQKKEKEYCPDYDILRYYCRNRKGTSLEFITLKFSPKEECGNKIISKL